MVGSPGLRKAAMDGFMLAIWIQAMIATPRNGIVFAAETIEEIVLAAGTIEEIVALESWRHRALVINHAFSLVASASATAHKDTCYHSAHQA